MKLKNGFLDLQLNEAMVTFRREHQPEYLVIFKIMSFLDELQNMFTEKTVSKQDIFLCASILELNKLFQSAVLLYERGLPEAAKIVTRSILELSFKIIELIRNENFLQEMKLAISCESLNTLIKMQKTELYDLIDKNQYNELVHDFQQIKSQNSKVDIKAVTLAQRNGLEKEYILYRMYCGYTHLSGQVVNEIIEYNPDGAILNGDLKLDDFSESIAMLASITMISFPKIVKHSLVDKNMEYQLELLQEDFLKAFKPV